MKATVCDQCKKVLGPSTGEAMFSVQCRGDFEMQRQPLEFCSQECLKTWTLGDANLAVASSLRSEMLAKHAASNV